MRVWMYAGLLVLGAPARGQASDPAAQSAAVARFKAFDASGNGYLSGTELDACGCRGSDADGDGRVTALEFLSARGTLPGARPSRRAPAPPRAASAAPASPPRAAGGVPAGQYECYTFLNGSLVHQMAFTITGPASYKDGDGKAGSYTKDAAGIVRFRGGSLDGTQGDFGYDGARAMIYMHSPTKPGRRSSLDCEGPKRR